MKNVIEEYADFCAAAEVPQTVRAAAVVAMLDLLGVAAAGSSTPSGRASMAAAPAIWGPGDSKIWFSGRKTTATGATFVNSTFAAALDLDDGHRLAAGHPGAAIIPAAVCISDERGCRPSEMLDAIVIGYEVGVRIAAARDVRRLRTTDTGLWCGYGVAASVSRLRGLAPPLIANAMAISGQTSTRQTATGATRIGHTVKEGIPWAAANGVMAGFLAEQGHIGPIDMLEDDGQFDRRSLLGGLGQTWAISQLYFKQYSCCRWAHAAIDAALVLKERHKIALHEIVAIEVETFPRALSLPNQAEPHTAEAAQYSIPFCIALALTYGKEALLPFDAARLSDQMVVALARRVHLSAAPKYASAFPASTPAKVTIRTSTAMVTIEVLYPLGDPTNPLDDEQIKQKFFRLCCHLPPEAAHRLLDQTLSLSTAGSSRSFHQSLNMAREFAAPAPCATGRE